MVHNNKILTVSYGTFSCTLEGFDDSFGTMKAIAEYFRDLASDDRYFGAEPPQPDAEMLARIAQKEISRRVEGRSSEDGGIVLRAEDTGAAHSGALAAPAQQPEPKAVPTAAASEVAAQPEAAPPVAEPTPDTVSESLMSRFVEQSAKAEAAASGALGEPAPLDDDLPVDDLPEAEPVNGIVPAADSIAAKLQRIRAVVSQNEQAAEDVTYSEDEHAAARSDQSMAPAPTQWDDTYEEDDQSAAVSSSYAQLQSAFDAVEKEIGATADNAEIEAATRAIDSAFDQTAAEQADDPLTLTPEIRIDAQADADDVEDLFEDLDGDDDAADDDEMSNILGDVDTSEEAEEADVDASSDLLPESEPELSPLLSDVGQTPSEPGNMADVDGYDETYDEAPASSVSNSMLPPVGEDDTDDLSRLMDAAREKMEGPENATSRETYTHMRAAMAAAEAEKSAGGDVNAAKGDDAYREDLASVVRPRRPVAKAERPSRPAADSRPAPLKLVAEQRVDTDEDAAPRGPVRPRRVAAAEHDITSGGPDGNAEDGFAAFAANMGATELSDLLEAAASYMSFVEGRDQFSRPQLMNKVRQVEDSGFNREDGLRSFGRLLRQGKIEKTGGGRFTASGDIGFRPDERAAG